MRCRDHEGFNVVKVSVADVRVERDDLAIHDSSIRQAAQRFNNIRESFVQDFLIPRVERDRVAGFNGYGAIAVQLDLPDTF